MAEQPAQVPAAAPAKKEKIVPPSPPLKIKDRDRGYEYMRVGFLGEGGFARVYEVQDQRATRRAVKVVSKASIKTKKNKTKLWAEIKLHQMLAHPNIVRFDDCFEDEENVYMILELCHHGSLMDLLRRRKRYTEPEARYYLVQLIAACQYMHQTNVIHRDLKLGNLFLDENMDIKVGDFGLAALIEKPGDRKKTICGTPNYIAPEVLFDTANGHSFEVDVWSVGVILYTLLIGKPPFQTKDVKAIYKRIRENRYEFPPEKEISSSAQELITLILNTNPDKRPNLGTILSHPWLLDGPFPAYIPASANDFAPDYRHISSSQSRRNFAALCHKSKIGVAQSINIEPARSRSALGPSIMQQERDFKNAVQPDSPISALLNSARQPLIQASAAAIKEPSLLRKLSAAGAASTLSPVRKGAIGKENHELGKRHTVMERVGEGSQEECDAEEVKPKYNGITRESELAAQKARIVSQMAAERQLYTETMEKASENGASGKRPVYQESRSRVAAAPRGTLPLAATTAQPTVSTFTTASSDTASKSGNRYTAYESSRPEKTRDFKTSLFETFGQNLSTALALAQTEEGFVSPSIESKPRPPRVFVVSWLDYCTKYGMGFAMTDGTVSVHFNDSTSLVLAPGKRYFDDIRPAGADDLSQNIRRNYSIERYPSDLKNKVYLLKHFENYMLDKLFGDQPYTFEDKELTTEMVFVVRYLRMKHVILFRLSNDVLQFNFYDHTKLILSREGLVVTVIDRHSVMRTWSLEELLRPLDDDLSPKDKKRIEGIVHKVQYAKDVLGKIKSHTSSSKAAAVSNNVPVSANTRSAAAVEREMGRPIR
ncbi:PLK/PLK1 protein kinase [Cryptococcus gattii Ru294]|nr:PLK/PLK1 protein kinase [Cryptococcus gattii Ru294]